MDETQLIQDGVAISHAIAIGKNDVEIGVMFVDSFTANVQYTKDDLKKLAARIAAWKEDKKNIDGSKKDFSLTRSDWLEAQARNWTMIWCVPAILITACFVVFLLLGRNPKEETKTKT
jgi:uncharacterized protein YecE (DUF72 family)